MSGFVTRDSLVITTSFLKSGFTFRVKNRFQNRHALHPCQSGILLVIALHGISCCGFLGVPGSLGEPVLKGTPGPFGALGQFTKRGFRLCFTLLILTWRHQSSVYRAKQTLSGFGGSSLEKLVRLNLRPRSMIVISEQTSRKPKRFNQATENHATSN